jgi:hypothetical protein
MTVADIKSLPIEEKFLIMETLWEEMRDLYEQSEIPQAHKDLLDLRRARVESGEAKLVDWDSVKSSIGSCIVIIFVWSVKFSHMAFSIPLKMLELDHTTKPLLETEKKAPFGFGLVIIRSMTRRTKRLTR